MTSWPDCRSRCVTWNPINPAQPVSNTLFIQKHPFYRLDKIAIKQKTFKKVPPCRRVPETPTNEKICFPQAFWHGLKPTSGWAKFHPAFCAGTTVLRPARGQHS